MISFTVIITIISITYLSILREQKIYQSELKHHAELVLDTLEAALSDKLYNLDVNFMSDMMEVLGEDQHILTMGRVYGAEGRILADAYAEKMTYKMDIDPFGKELIKSKTRKYVWYEDHLIAGQPVIAGNQILGAISIGLPTLYLKIKITNMRNQGIGMAAGAIIIGILMALIFSRSITGPLKEMVKITRQVEKGDFDQKIIIHSHNELNELAGSFNDMITKLNDAHNRLEQQVLERTSNLEETNKLLKNEIIDHKDTMVKLRESKIAAEAANIAKSEFLTNMSHELRTPLNHIIGFTEMLLGKYFGEIKPEQEENMTYVLESGKHLLSLISDILDLSKVDAGRIDLHVSNVNPKLLLESSIIIVKEKAMKHNIELSVLLDELPENIIADIKILKQILYNLLSNAVKFTPDGGKVILRAKKIKDSEKEEQSVLEISISDSGIGIDKEDLERIFYPFEQVDNSQTRRYQGTGLGLSLTKRLVEIHGGTISAESNGEGAVFRVTIPLVQ